MQQLAQQADVSLGVASKAKTALVEDAYLEDRDRVLLEAGNKLKSMLEHLDAKEVETGANCILWITDDSAVFTDSKEIDGVMVVSPLQLYLDLMALSGRVKDAAEEVFDRELRPLFAAGKAKSEGDQ